MHTFQEGDSICERFEMHSERIPRGLVTGNLQLFRRKTFFLGGSTACRAQNERTDDIPPPKNILSQQITEVGIIWTGMTVY